MRRLIHIRATSTDGPSPQPGAGGVRSSEVLGLASSAAQEARIGRGQRVRAVNGVALIDMHPVGPPLAPMCLA